VCLQPADKKWDVSHTINFGKHSTTLTLPMPLCDQHFAITSTKTRAERWIERLGFIMGIAVGVGFTLGAPYYWSVSQPGNLILKLFIGAFVGLGMFLIVWSLLAFSVAPLFVDPAAKAVRNAMSIRRYGLANQDLELEFADAVTAELIAEINAERLVRKE
jgi:hypothetical protein